MKFFVKTIITGAAFVAMSHASAAGVVNASAIDGDIWVSNVTGSAKLDFSARFLSLLNVAAPLGSPPALKGIEPAALTITARGRRPYGTASVNAPLAGLSFEGSGTHADISSLGSLGGFRLALPNDEFISYGGFVDITNLSVDLLSNVVYADFKGANGVKSLKHVHLFDAASRQGSLVLEAGGTSATSLTFAGLNASTFALSYFDQALGLISDTGGAAFHVVDNFGTLTFNVSANVAAVPEPSEVALIGAGLAALAMVRRRARKQA
jgi:hypothetical protein